MTNLQVTYVTDGVITDATSAGTVLSATVTVEYGTAGEGAATWIKGLRTYTLGWTSTASSNPQGSTATLSLNGRTIGTFSFSELATQLGLAVAALPS